MALAKHFLELIDSRAREEKIHQFLVDHPEILHTAMHRSDQIITKPSLHRYIPDFAAGTEGRSLRRWSWTLIEIEPADYPLITKGGSPTARLTHAVKQVADWRNWISENTAYARTILPDITPACHGLIVMGRRSTLTDRQAKELMAYQDSLKDIRIHSYDWLHDIIARGLKLNASKRHLRIIGAWQKEFDWDDDE
jgi:hypothetical protein